MARSRHGLVNTLALASGLGYPYIRGEGVGEGGVWYDRFTTDADGKGRAIYLGYDGRNWWWWPEHDMSHTPRPIPGHKGRT